MPLTLPFLTTYDPLGTSEGTLDPLGLYQIADLLAGELIPGIRERMQRLRFLTPMVVGAMVTEELEDTGLYADASPTLVWEWLVIEAFVRTADGDGSLQGTAGVQKARNALGRSNYIDAQSYLKTPRIFGFHGVYKRLAVHLGLMDVHLGRGPTADLLLDAWAKDRGHRSFGETRPVIAKWTKAVAASMGKAPPRTAPGWTNDGWSELAEAFLPAGTGRNEKRVLRQLLLDEGSRRLGAVPELWPHVESIARDEEGPLGDDALHRLLERSAPQYSTLLRAIRAYERFARSLQDCFDMLRICAGRSSATAFDLALVGRDEAFSLAKARLAERCRSAAEALGTLTGPTAKAIGHFNARFAQFAEPMDARALAGLLVQLHEKVQREKSEDGKRSWFDRLGEGRVHLRLPYRISPIDPEPDKWVHPYRAAPLVRFARDLA